MTMALGMILSLSIVLEPQGAGSLETLCLSLLHLT